MDWWKGEGWNGKKGATREAAERKDWDSRFPADVS